MDLALNIATQAAATAPTPFLRPLFASLQLIHSTLEQLSANAHQMRALAHTAAQILGALNGLAEVDVDAGALAAFREMLGRVEALAAKMGRRRFVRAFLESAADEREIGVLHGEMEMCVDALQVGAQVRMRESAERVEAARRADVMESDKALRALLEKQDALLELVGGTEQPEGSPTVFQLLEGILAALKTADTGHEDAFQEVLAQLRTDAPAPAPDPNPLLARLQPGLTPAVLVPPLQFRVHKLQWEELLGMHFAREEWAARGFLDPTGGAARFVEYVVACDERALQYAAVEVFSRDKELQHFFKKDFKYTPSGDPNPVLAHLKPGLTPTVLVPPLRFALHRYRNKDILTQHLDAAQVAAFFGSGAEGCAPFIEYITEGDDVALQYAVLEVFREDKTVGHYFIKEG